MSPQRLKLKKLSDNVGKREDNCKIHLSRERLLIENVYLKEASVCNVSEEMNTGNTFPIQRLE